MDAVAKAVPDGYTIGFGAISTNALNPQGYAIANTSEAAALRSRVSTICCVAVFRAYRWLR